MESLITRTPSTPTRARSLGPNPGPGDPMEDSDVSNTRKRPRLDSGDRSYRSMSADPPRTSISEKDMKGQNPSPLLASALSSESETVKSSQDASLTPTKVTINVRDPASNSIPPSQSSGSEALPPTIRGGGLPEPSSDAPEASVVASGRSSPSQSPEIEVAEVEDMDSEPTQTRWRPLGGMDTIQSKQIQDRILREFPCFIQGRSLTKAIDVVANVLEKQDLSSRSILDELVTWLEAYFDDTEDLCFHWWDMYLARREFWDEFPSLIDAVVRRSNSKQGTVTMPPYFRGEMDTDPECALHNFFVLYSTLTLRMINIDEQTLESASGDPTVTPDLISERYMNTLAHIMIPNANFWRNTVDPRNFDIGITIRAMIRRFAARNHDGVESLAKMSKSQSWQSFDPKAWAPSNIVLNALEYYNQHYGNEEGGGLFEDIPLQAFRYFQDVESKVQTMISKQAPAFSIDTCQAVIPKLASILYHIAAANEDIGANFLLQTVPTTFDINPRDRPDFAQYAWKFNVLKRCVMEGRMEIRVFGVDCMQRDLVEIYQKYINNRPNSSVHSLAAYLSEWMLRNNLVEYLVGVESHAQLIQRSTNVVGFLVVTSRYTNDETELIWKVLTTSQDPSKIDALLNMIIGFMNVAPYPILLHVVTKLTETPFQLFDSNLLLFGRNLFDLLRRGWKPLSSEQKMDMPPYRLCIWLMRESAADAKIDNNKRQDIQRWASEELQSILSLGPGEQDLQDIYDECLKDIADHTKFATGSVTALYNVLRHKSERDFKRLAQHSNLTALLVDDVAHMIKSNPSSKPSLFHHEALNVRLTLLMDLTMLVSDSITSQFARNMWDVIVGANAMNDYARNSAWQLLIRLLNSTKSRNPFIDHCISEFLPQLDPSYIVPASLVFARDVAQYDSKFQDVGASTSDREQPERTSLTLLWQMSLSIPKGKPDLEARAINMLITQYLDSPGTLKRSRAVTDTVLLDLVERCIKQLTTAAAKLKSFSDGTSSGEDEPMVVVASEEETEAQRLYFARSMKILQEFIRGVRSYPMYSPEPQTQVTLPKNFHEIKGDPVKIKYQSFSGRSSSDIRTFEVGDQETGEELATRLKILTGFPHFTTIIGGQKIDIKENPTQLVSDLNIHQKGLLLVKKAAPVGSVPDLTPTSGLRPVEVTILEHFPELFELLVLEEDMARPVFDFLSAFPPHQSITAMVCSLNTRSEEIFPSAAPFKILYSTLALRTCLTHHLDHGVPVQDLMSHAVEVLTATITHLSLVLLPSGPEVEINVALALVECLSALLKEPTAFNDSKIPLLAPTDLVVRLKVWIQEALERSQESSDARKLIDECFTVLLQASAHSEPFRNAFVADAQFPLMIQRLILEESRLQIRQGVSKTIQNTCSGGQKSSNAPHELVCFVWKQLAAAIPQSLNYASHSQQFFEIANLVFRSLDHTTQQSSDLELNVSSWCNLLLGHSHREFVGRDEIDWVVLGFARLINHSLEVAKSKNSQIRVPENLLEDLFRKHLFPELSDFEQEPNSEVQIPNLHSVVRGELLLLITTISNEMPQYCRLLELIKDLSPATDISQAWSWGIAQIPDDYTWEPNYNFERAKSIRAPTGYPGLRNLSNTCYMNSLLTQLFMNTSFREFILKSRVADSEGSQRLLHQTRNLFGYLQESFLKSVDTQGVADSVVTYDNTVIDVTIQMDVDEFYNLLFDRWESQILDNKDKQTFRSFYGGHIVQQIKSKQCEHISERLEPFFAIQCDINGKHTLMESLSAYVSGEVMEGDNKYSCTSCGSYVEAVKRACLKDIPDNLIFHLKRFDYDVMTGMRSKINSRFEFPREIDMSPYHVDSLKDPHAPRTPDVFELVGVLVHSGSAESGHYYSYIQERPSTAAAGKVWVEFNDIDVSYIDSASLDDQCFGGWADPSLYTAPYVKVWNAYMLFYERVDPKLSKSATTTPNIPAKCKMPSDLQSQIDQHNEMFLRQYCLFDPAHAAFSRTMLDQLRSVEGTLCTRDHSIEASAITLALEYLDRVQSRTKDCPNLEKMLATIMRNIGSCPQCCQIALTWLASHESTLRNLLLRCPLSKVRKDFAAMILMALKYLRDQEPESYGIADGVDSWGNLHQSPMDHTDTIFSDLLDRLKDLWQYLHLHPKGWDDYFGLLADLANIGKPETHLMLAKQYLQKCLETLVIDSIYARTLRSTEPFYQHYTRLVEKGRKFNIGKLAELTATLLCSLDLQKPVYQAQVEIRPYDQSGFRLCALEEELLCLGSRHPPRPKDTCVFLDKILTNGSNPQAAKRILQTILASEPPFRLHGSIRTTLQTGISVDPAVLAAPYLRAALTYCESAASANSAETLIRFISTEVDAIGKSGGAEHLEFFVQARRLQNTRLNKPPKYFHRVVRRTIPHWAPTLLSYFEEGVRLATIQLLRILLFTQDAHEEDDEEQDDEMTRVGKALCLACAQKGENQVQKREPLEVPKAWEQLIEVTRDCIKNFYQDESEEQVQQIEVVLGSLEALSVSDPEDAPSENWNNSADDMPTDSDSETYAASP